MFQKQFIFGQTRRFMGVNVEHKISDNFGATFLKMSERPFTQKSSFGQSQLTILFLIQH
jgi:cell surface protein SprA